MLKVSEPKVYIIYIYRMICIMIIYVLCSLRTCGKELQHDCYSTDSLNMLHPHV